MPTLTDDAIALRHWEYSETSQTVALFTRTHGVLRAMAKGAKREKGNFSGGIEVLTRGRAVAIVKQTTDLATLTAWDLLGVYWRTRADLGAHRVGLYMVDLTYHAITDHDPHPGLYDSLLGALDELEAGVDASQILARFQWALLTEVGSRPNLEGERPAASATVYFHPEGGRVTAAASPGSWPVRRSTVEWLRAEDWSSAADDPEPEVPGRACLFLAEYLAHVLGRDLATRRALYGPLVMRRESGQARHRTR